MSRPTNQTLHCCAARRALGVELYRSGLNYETVGRLLQVSNVTVGVWIKEDAPEAIRRGKWVSRMATEEDKARARAVLAAFPTGDVTRVTCERRYVGGVYMWDKKPAPPLPATGSEFIQPLPRARLMAGR